MEYTHKFSIVTTSFNSGSTIRDTLESVLMQTFLDYEYIVIDGKSKDNTLDIIKEYEPKFNGRMRYISEPDNGIYDAMNKGLKMCKGEVLMLINSDDLFLRNDTLELLNQKFNENPGIDCVYTNLYYVMPNNTDKIVRTWYAGERRPFNTGWAPCHPTFYVKRYVYEKAGYFDEEFKLSADFELMLRFCEKYKISMVYFNEFFVKMRLGGATSNIKNLIKQNVEVVRAFKKNNLKAGWFYTFKRIIPKFKQFFQ